MPALERNCSLAHLIVQLLVHIRTHVSFTSTIAVWSQVAEVRCELQEQFGEEEPYIPPIEAVESGALPPPITEPIELPVEIQRVVEQHVTPPTTAALGVENTYVEVVLELPPQNQIQPESPVDPSSVVHPQPTGEQREPDEPLNAGTTYLTVTNPELQQESPSLSVPIQEEEPKSEPEPAPVPEPAPPPHTPEPKPSEVEPIGVEFQQRRTPEPLPTVPAEGVINNRELEEKMQEAALKIREMETEDKRIKEEVPVQVASIAPVLTCMQ